MLTAAVCVVMVVSMTSPVTWAFSAGNIGGKCGASADMKPSHGYDEQATPFTYTLTVAGGATTYTPGSQLTLNLAGGSFKGFLVQVVDASGNLVSGLAPTDSDAQALTCVGAGASTGLSHTTGSVKSSLAFTWTPPAGTNGQVDFQVTVVEEYVTYWIKQTALALIEGGAVPPVSLPQTSTAVSPTDSPSLTTTSVSISSSTTTTSTTTETQSDATTDYSASSAISTTTSISSNPEMEPTSRSSVNLIVLTSTDSIASSTSEVSTNSTSYSTTPLTTVNERDLTSVSAEDTNAFTVTDSVANSTSDLSVSSSSLSTTPLTQVKDKGLVSVSAVDKNVLTLTDSVTISTSGNPTSSSSDASSVALSTLNRGQISTSSNTSSTSSTISRSMTTTTISMESSSATLTKTAAVLFNVIPKESGLDAGIETNEIIDKPSMFPDIHHHEGESVRQGKHQDTNHHVQTSTRSFEVKTTPPQTNASTTTEGVHRTTSPVILTRWRQKIGNMIRSIGGGQIETPGETFEVSPSEFVVEPVQMFRPEPIVTDAPNAASAGETDDQKLGGIQADAACGVSKGCFQDCTGGSCRYLVTWQDFGQAVAFEMYGMVKSADSYIALGFSSDRKMGSDSVIECVANNGGEVRVFNSYNNGYSNQRLTPSDYGISNFQGGISNGVLRCRFFRIKSANGTALENTMYDLNQDWHLMFATGPAMQGFLMMPHSTTDLPPVSSSRVDLQSSATAVGQRADTDPLVKAHGCVMIFAWVMFTSIGILAARYYKSAWSDKTFFGLKIWFQVHRACMVVALVLNSIGFILIFVAIKGYSTILGETYLKSHPVLGIIVTALCLTNPIMAFFRPGGDSDKRWIFNWAHWGVGMTAYILSAVTICFGFKLPKARTPSYAIYIMIVYVIYVIIIDVIFELIECMNKKEKSAKVEGMEMTAKNGTDNGAVPNGNINTKDKMRKVDKMKTFFLALHIAFTGAFALVLTLVVALN